MGSISGDELDLTKFAIKYFYSLIFGGLLYLSTWIKEKVFKMHVKLQTPIKCIILAIMLLTAKIVGSQSTYPCGAVEQQKNLFKKDRKWFENQELTEEIILRNSKFRSG